jgi:hypothetical protein
MIEESMKKHIGQRVALSDGEIEIQGTCNNYEGDFYTVLYVSGPNSGQHKHINIWTEKGRELTEALPEIYK